MSDLRQVPAEPVSVLLGAILGLSDYMIVCEPVLLADMFCEGAEAH